MSGRFSESPRPPLATSAQDGLLSAADKAKLDRVGGATASYIGADQAVGAGVNAFFGTIALTPGTWVILGTVTLLMGAAPATISALITTAAGAPAGGTVTLTQAAGWWGQLHPFTITAVAASTSYRVMAQANGAWTAKWTGGILVNGTETGLAAWRIA